MAPMGALRRATVAALATALFEVHFASSTRVQLSDEARLQAATKASDAGPKWRTDSTQAEAGEVADFVCPLLCTECCQAQRRFLFNMQDTKRFKCILPTADLQSMNASSMGGRTCSKPAVRESDPYQAKTECEFSEAEYKRGEYARLRKCSYDGPRVRSYKEFIGDHACSLTGKVDIFGVSLVGTAIDHMYFSAEGGVLSSGVCGMKAKEFEQNGLMGDMCKNQTKACPAKVKQDLCNQLSNDLEAGRLDRFSMAAWAAAIGPMPPVKSFPTPAGPPRVLKKFSIPGWNARKVAYETLEEDNRIELSGGAFMCMMTKMQGLPLEDDLTGPMNKYVDPDHPVPGQKAFYPRKSPDVLRDYFDKFTVYQKVSHFAVEPAELQSDSTLSKLIFQAIGAHRIEHVNNGALETLSPIYIVGTLPSTTSQQFGLLEESTKKHVKFSVRLEGLYEDVPVRKDMARWGGNAFFSGTGEIVALQYDGTTALSPTFGGVETPNWHEMKFAFRSSLISTVTAFDHLVSTHILVSETLSIAVYETLPATHGLRLLLTPHTWGSLAINFKAANNLFPANMLVHRASPFEADAFAPKDGGDGILWKKAAILRYRPFKESYAAYRRIRDALAAEGVQAPAVPFFDDGIVLHEAISKYVQGSVEALYGVRAPVCSGFLQSDWSAAKFINRFFEVNDAATKDFWPAEYRKATWSCEALVNLLTESIFLVTGFHRHVGTVPDFFRDTSFAATAWKHGETQARPKHTLLMQLLAATTNANNPKLANDITGMYHSHSELYKVARTFAEDMRKVQSTIEQANERRQAAGDLAFHQMEPKFVEWGVEV